FGEEAFTKQQIAQLISNPYAISLAAKHKGSIIGFVIGILRHDGNPVGHILTIDVIPEYRRLGVGTRLLMKIERIFKEIGARKCQLEVREDNVAALRLYRKLGYRKIRKLYGYYGTTDGILLEKILTQQDSCITPI
ncbi:GNAT family N-acetyltransferase, partial [Candidatus Bathyarchaeota archaeon]|nr:GNAT family N-acetyltransferase [Candidatus Bathyarchaeota archaeon]